MYFLSQCVAWYPQSEPDDLLAIGQSNGKVIVTRFITLHFEYDL